MAEGLAHLVRQGVLVVSINVIGVVAVGIGSAASWLIAHRTRKWGPCQFARHIDDAEFTYLRERDRVRGLDAIEWGLQWRQASRPPVRGPHVQFRRVGGLLCRTRPIPCTHRLSKHNSRSPGQVSSPWSFEPSGLGIGSGQGISKKGGLDPTLALPAWISSWQTVQTVARFSSTFFP